MNKVEWKDARKEIPPRGRPFLCKQALWAGPMQFQDGRFITSRCNPNAMDGRFNLDINRYFLWMSEDDYCEFLESIPVKQY